MEKIIVSTGYMGSGSSAITYLVSEFEGCSNDLGSFEYVFLHCPNGLFDLEDKLLVSNNSLRSDEAIRTFEKCMDDLNSAKYWWVGNYHKHMGDIFEKSTKEFISQITKYNYDGFWYMHEKTDFKMFCKLLVQKPFKLLFGAKFEKVLKYNDGMRVSFVKADEFYEHAKEFVKNILNRVANGQSTVVLDQLLLPYNLHRIDNYFDDNLKVIVTERDPRDVFISNKYIWNHKNVMVPFPLDVDAFCQFYREMRESEKITNSDKILRVKFEDLIYKYADTVSEIRDFLGFKESQHIHKFERFDLEKSAKNTQQFRHEMYTREVAIIEDKLSEYLYDFPFVVSNSPEDTYEGIEE